MSIGSTGACFQRAVFYHLTGVQTLVDVGSSGDLNILIWSFSGLLHRRKAFDFVGLTGA